MLRAFPSLLSRIPRALYSLFSLAARVIFRKRTLRWMMRNWLRLLIALLILPASLFLGMKLSAFGAMYVIPALGGLFALSLFIRRLLPVALIGAASYLLASQIATGTAAQAVLMLVGLFVLGLIIVRVDLALVLLMIISATIMYPTAVPKPFTFGGAGLGTGELLLIFTLFVGFIKTCVSKRHVSSPLILPVMLLILSAVVALIISYLVFLESPRGFYQFSNAYNTARPLFYYIYFLAILFGIKDKREYRLFFNITLALACIVALAVCVQYVLGNRVNLFFGTPGTFSFLKEQEEGVTRIQPPGIPLNLLMLVTTLYLAAAYRGKIGTVYSILVTVLTAGIVFSFARNAWIAIGIAFILLLILTPMNVKGRLVTMAFKALAGGIALSLIIAAITPSRASALSEALSERFMSIVQIGETSKSTSVETRRIENRHALKWALQNPVFGVGLGTPVVHRYVSGITMRGPSMRAVSSDTIHNSYLDMWLQYGLLGLTAYAWISVAFIYRAFSLWKRADEQWVKAIGIGFALAYIMLLMRSVVVMTLVRQLWEITVAAYMWGMVEVGFLVAVNTKGNETRQEADDSDITPTDPVKELAANY